MKVYIEKTFIGYNELLYTLRLFFFNKGISYLLVNSSAESDISFSKEKSDFPISYPFYEKIKDGIFDSAQFFKDDLYIKTDSGEPDYFATVFYLVNCLQEYGITEIDEVGRFKYINSLQYKYNIVERNLVQEIFDQLAQHLKFKKAVAKQQEITKLFLSHDIDTVYGALGQDGFYALKNGRIDIMMKLLLNAMIAKPDWMNMDKIMKIEDERDFKSTFFWLVNSGRINKRMVNSDYNITSAKIKEQIKNISTNGWENNLHKSISNESYATEIAKAGFPVTGNRCHYLRFTLPGTFDAIEQAALKFDATLGFAEHYGFRNSYGQPFHPYNITRQRPYNFVEIPLHIMDTTFHRYLKTPPGDIFNLIIAFIEKNKYNCLLSILWHNTYFTNYKFKGYMNTYKQLLAYFYENKMPCLTASEIVKQYQ